MLTAHEIADVIVRFVENRSTDELEWDDFISVKYRKHPKFEAVRLQCLAVADEFPPDVEGEYCNADGYVRLRQIAEELRQSSE
jgi:hypothetical protein